jgi:GNAT superfamily N-acetyltransferase
MPKPRSTGLLLAAAAALLLAGCAAERSPRECLLEFTRAIQDRDAATLFCLSAGAAGSDSLGADPEARRDGFERWLEEELRVYEEARDEGAVELSGHGVRLVKLLAIGRGTFYQEVGRTGVGDDGLLLRTRLDMAYSQIDLSGLSPGTTFYVATAPVGRVVPVVVPAQAKEIRVEVLESVMVDWTLLREEAVDGCPGGYKIASVEPVESSAETRPLTWLF